MMLLVMIGLAGAVVYLLSDLNRRTYRLAQVGQTMVVQKGKFMPTGFENYQPDESRLREAYAPIALPSGEQVPGGQLFEDRTDLDRAMFSILAAWARQQLGSEDLTVSSQAADYIQRCILLPGVSEEQRRDIAVLRADLSFRKGQNLLTGIVNQLEAAATKFKEAIEQGTSFKGEAQKSLAQVEARIKVLTGEVDVEATPEGDAAPEQAPQQAQEETPEDATTEGEPAKTESPEDTAAPLAEEKAQDVEL
jgi:exonuclease VII small subunit